MRDIESECVAEMRGAGGTMVVVGAVSTLLTRGDFSGLSMLRPTRLHRGILKMCLQADSPERRRCRRRIKSRKKEAVGRKGEQRVNLVEERRGSVLSGPRRHAIKRATFLTPCTARQKNAAVDSQISVHAAAECFVSADVSWALVEQVRVVDILERNQKA